MRTRRALAFQGGILANPAALTTKELLRVITFVETVAVRNIAPRRSLHGDQNDRPALSRLRRYRNVAANAGSWELTSS